MPRRRLGSVWGEEMRIGVALMVSALVLAGCVEETPVPTPEVTVLEGVVVDPALAPVPGAMVLLVGSSRSNVTDDQGRFRFQISDAHLEHPVLRVTMDGFQDFSHVVPEALSPGSSTHVRLGLSYASPDEPYRHDLPFNGIIACSALAVVGHNHGGNAHEDDDIKCAAEGTSDDVWEFDVAPGIKNVVIEVAWEPDTMAAEYLSMTIEGVGVDDDEDVQFYFVEGTSPLRGSVSRLQSAVYFEEEGGTVRLSVQVAGPESDVVASAAINQEFRAIASMFYVKPGPSDFSLTDA